MKDAISNPGSTEVCASAPCSYDAFLRIFRQRPDTLHAGSKPAVGVVYKPGDVHKRKDWWRRRAGFTERHHSVTLSSQDFVLRLLDLERSECSQVSGQAWKSLVVHKTNGVACAAIAPVKFTHVTNRKKVESLSVSLCLSCAFSDHH